MNDNKDFISHTVHLPGDPSINVLKQNEKYKESLKKQKREEYHKKKEDTKFKIKAALWTLGLIVLNVLFQLFRYYKDHSEFEFNWSTCIGITVLYCLISFLILTITDMLKSVEKYEKTNKAKQKQIADLKKQSEQDKQDNKPQCPTCHSYNVRPISGLNRAGSIFAWGLFSSKIGKTYECLNCKYKW